MAISRKRVLEKIAGYRKAIDYHLDEHIPNLIDQVNKELVGYWRKEVSFQIATMKQWSARLSKHDHLLAVASEYERRLHEMLDRRLAQLND